MRLLSVELPDDMHRLQGSGVRASVQDHGRGAGGAPTQVIVVSRLQVHLKMTWLWWGHRN